MLATLGLFVFRINTAPYQRLQRTTQQRWIANNIMSGRPRYQHAGKGEDTITLSGTLRPEITGGRVTLDILRMMADSGKAWPFLDGEGTIYGLWFIENVTETRSQMLKYGEARQIDFTVTIKRYDDSIADKLGVLSRVGLGALGGASKVGGKLLGAIPGR